MEFQYLKISKDYQDLEKAMAVGLKACELGREVLLKYFGRLEKVEEKFQAGLVSEADQESEKVIIDYIKNFFPNSEFLGEEATAAGAIVRAGRGDHEGRWILDPLDGTTNYVHRFQIFCISLALEIDGEVVLGIVNVPLLGEVYTCIKNHGVFLNGQPIKASPTLHLRDALLATGFFAENERALEEQLKLFAKLVRCSRGVRRPGAAAYDLCLVAKGVFDAFWERNLKPWDVAAGALFVQESGGIVTTYRGNAFDPYKNSIIASAKNIHSEIQNNIFPLINEDTD